MVVCLQSGCFFGHTAAESSTAELRVVLKRHAADETTPRHSHARPYLALVAAGAFRQFGPYGEHLCTPGALAINTSGAEHHDRFEAQSDVLDVELPASWLERLRADGVRDPGYRWSTHPGLALRARTLRAHLEHPEALSAIVIEGLAAELLLLALGDVPPLHGRAPAWLPAVEDALRAQFRRPPPLAELAALAGRSPSQVVRAFRQWRGTTPGGFARRLRAEHAQRTLLASRASLSTIALAAGYSDQSHMTRELGLHLGSTPGRLRRGSRDAKN